MKDKSIDEQRFLRLIDENRSIIYKVCYLYAKDEEHLKDLYQEMLINLWRGLANYKGEAKLTTWVYRVCINSCISFHRKHREPADTLPIETLVNTLPDGENRTAQLREMYRLINRLNALEKAIILLWLDERTYEEIAEVTGFTRNNIASKLKRIKEKLTQYANE